MWYDRFSTTTMIAFIFSLSFTNDFGIVCNLSQSRDCINFVRRLSAVEDIRTGVIYIRLTAFVKHYREDYLSTTHVLCALSKQTYSISSRRECKRKRARMEPRLTSFVWRIIMKVSWYYKPVKKAEMSFFFVFSENTEQKLENHDSDSVPDRESSNTL